MKELIDLFVKWFNGISSTPVQDGGNSGKSNEDMKFISEEMPWVVSAIIAAFALWLPEDMKKYAMFASLVIIFLAVLFRYYQHKHGNSNTNKNRKIGMSIRAVALILVVLICGRSCFGKATENPPQTEPTAQTIPTTVNGEIFGWDEIVDAKPGDTIYFGEYRQSNWTEDKQKIAWLVLEKENDRLLLVSKQGLDCKQYNESGEACTWETSSIRAWLNKDFMFEAFDTHEQARIVSTSVGAHGNPEVDSAYAGNNTDDWIFLLSIEEVMHYFKTAEERQAFPTEFAILNGSGYDRDIEGGPCWWWLRTPGQDNSRAADVKSGGAINYEGYGVASRNFSVRPALWLDVSDD